MEWFIAVVVIAALGVAALAAAGGMGAMSNDPVRDTYRQDLPPDRPLGADDVARLRFGVTVRGYAMGQVDDVLDRLRREIAERDALIADLTAAPDVPAADSHHPTDPHPTDPHHADPHHADPHHAVHADAVEQLAVPAPSDGGLR